MSSSWFRGGQFNIDTEDYFVQPALGERVRFINTVEKTHRFGKLSSI